MSRGASSGVAGLCLGVSGVRPAVSEGVWGCPGAGGRSPWGPTNPCDPLMRQLGGAAKQDDPLAKGRCTVEHELEVNGAQGGSFEHPKERCDLLASDQARVDGGAGRQGCTNNFHLCVRKRRVAKAAYNHSDGSAAVRRILHTGKDVDRLLCQVYSNSYVVLLLIPKSWPKV